MTGRAGADGEMEGLWNGTEQSASAPGAKLKVTKLLVRKISGEECIRQRVQLEKDL